jgi:hypothetical protein
MVLYRLLHPPEARNAAYPWYQIEANEFTLQLSLRNLRPRLRTGVVATHLCEY